MVETFVKCRREKPKWINSKEDSREAKDLCASVLLDQVTVIFDVISERYRQRKLYQFYYGEHLSLADFCVAAFLKELSHKEPTLMPVILDSYEQLKPYVGRVSTALNLDITF